jgi:cytochrome c-type biogenesis protein CcmH/NrfG
MKGLKSLAVLGAAVLALVLAVLLIPHPASAQVSATGVRGFISDEQGQRLADVDVEIQYTGEGTKRTYHVKTNKKGGFVRIGLAEGSYKIYLTKEGYQKKGIDMPWLSLGGLSDMCGNVNRGPNDPCEDIVMKKATVAISIGEGGGAGTGGGGGAAPGGGAAAAGGAATATPEEAAKLGAAYTQAVEAIKAGQWDVAETALKEVLAKIPDQPIVHFNLGHVYRQKKDYPAAEAEFKRATELEPSKADAFVAMAALYEAEGKGAEAVDFLVQNAAAFEQDAKFQVALGATAMNQGRDKEAEEAFAKAAALDPSNVEVQYYLASLALNRNEVDDAIAHLEKYIAAAPATSANVETAKSLLAALQAKKK